VMLARRKGLR